MEWDERIGKVMQLDTLTNTHIHTQTNTQDSRIGNKWMWYKGKLSICSGQDVSPFSIVRLFNAKGFMARLNRPIFKELVA